jgi:hypothetical protein
MIYLEIAELALNNNHLLIPNAPWNLFVIAGQNWTSELLCNYLLEGGVNQMWLLKNYKDM